MIMKYGRHIDVIADDRERPGGDIEFLSKIKQVTVRIRRLPIGDYRIENRLLFARRLK